MNPPNHDAPAGNATDGFIPLPRPVKQKIKDSMVALAMASWCFVRIWTHLLFEGNRFFADHPARPAELLALAVNILGLALILWLGIGVWRRSRTWLLSLVLSLSFLFLLVFPVDFFRAQIITVTDPAFLGFLKQPAVILVLFVALILLIWKHRLAARAVALVIVATLPVAILTLVKLFLVCCNLTQVNACPYAVPPPPLLPVREGRPRVVWIIFDEMDYRLAFEQRPAGLALPEFDRLRQESLSADHAYAPADLTIVSMPALIAGHRLAGDSRDSCDLALTLAGTHTNIDWTALPSVFSQARELGFNTALVGWYIPYARLLGGSLDYCSWYPMSQPVNATNFGVAMGQEIASLVWPFRSRQTFIDMCQNSLKDSLSLVGNPVYGLILLHLPPPHSPGVYLPDKKKFTWMGVPKPWSYFNNVALADHELGELRREMETSGQWDKTWLILSADHSWRTSKIYDGVRDYRVPFLVKPPGGGQGQTFSNPFNTVLTHDFILAILRNEVTSQSGAAAWLNTHITPDLPVTPANAVFE